MKVVGQGAFGSVKVPTSELSLAATLGSLELLPRRISLLCLLIARAAAACEAQE